MCAVDSRAQLMSVNIESGMRSARLISAGGSTQGTRNIRYGFINTGFYLSGELRFIASPQTHFSFGYQYSPYSLGVKFVSNGASTLVENTYESIDLHNFSVGYHYQRLVHRELLRVGWFAKLGIAYGYQTGYGYSGSSMTTATRPNDLEVIPRFWTPTSTIGGTIGMNFPGKKIADKLTCSGAVTLCWKDPYRDYSTVNYTIISGNSTVDGTARYRGRPLMLQIGVNYRLCYFGKGEHD